MSQSKVLGFSQPYPGPEPVKHGKDADGPLPHDGISFTFAEEDNLGPGKGGRPLPNLFNSVEDVRHGEPGLRGEALELLHRPVVHSPGLAASKVLDRLLDVLPFDRGSGLELASVRPSRVRIRASRSSA